MEDLQRPLPPRSVRDRIQAWVGWIGFGRIVGSAIAVVVVCAGVYWLVRSPQPPTEATLPQVTTSVVPSTTPMDASDGPADATAIDDPAGAAIDLKRRLVAEIDALGVCSRSAWAAQPTVVQSSSPALATARRAFARC